MNPLVATQTSHTPFTARFSSKLAAAAIALLALASEVLAAGSASVTLAWNSNPEPNLAGYRLKYGTSPGVYPNAVEAGPATSATATGLNQGTLYYFVVVAYNSVGQESPPSAAVSYTVPGTPNTAPLATSFAVTVLEDGQAAVNLSGTDAQGDVLSFSVVTAPAKGTLTGSGANLTYRPAANVTGSDSFTYRANDGALNSALATVSITITPVNDAPVANAASVSTARNTAVPITLGGSDVEGSPLTFSVLSSPSKGVLSGAAPNLTYTPNSNVTGADSFTFRVNDGSANSATATVSISIIATNTAPVATPRSVTTAEDTVVAILLSGTDADGNSLTYSVINNPTKGTLTGTAPNLSYRPNTNVNGNDSFTFRVNDGTVNSSAATVSITITPVNDAPVAVAKSVTTARNTAVGIVLSGTDVEGGPLTYTVLTSPTKGSLIGSAPNLTYTPNTNATGADSFTYRVNDGSANSAAATVSINITNNNQAPQAASRTLATMKNKQVSIQLTASDADANPLTFRVVGQPASGVLTGTPPNLAFKPEKNFVGNASFTYVANDGIVDSAVATVTIKVKPSNKKPVATAMTMVVNRNTATSVVLAGTDPDADPLSFAVLKQPLNGTLTGTAPNLVYVPNTGFLGADQFTFRANDGVVNSAASSVSIRVINPSNRAPASSAWSVSTPMKTAVPVTLRATDADGDPLVYRVVTKPANGRLTGKVPNLKFKPKGKFVGTTSFTYIASDGARDSAPITVTIQVTQPPTAATRGFGKSKGLIGIAPLPTLSLATDPARPGIIRLQITGLPGESYQLEHSPDLKRWDFDREVVIGDGGDLMIEVAVPPDVRCGFYRLNTP